MANIEKNVIIQTDKSLKEQLLDINLNQTVHFDIEKMYTIRSTIDKIKVQQKYKYKTWRDLQKGIVSVERIK